MLFWIKILVSGLIVALASEVSKRSSWLGGLIVALPLVSILTLCWLYFETRDLAKVTALSYSIVWFVLPSLAFFLILPWMIRLGLGFIPATTISCLGMLILFYGFSKILGTMGIQL